MIYSDTDFNEERVSSQTFIGFADVKVMFSIIFFLNNTNCILMKRKSFKIIL
jgi:hypothetical protein